MPLELFVIDAFTDTPFRGNPAAVTIVDAFPHDDRMQQVALEMNHSETAFVVRRGDGGHDLRWFTPTTEVDLCGHATLASAHLLAGSARFHTRSGLLTCRPVGDGWIELDLPGDPPSRDDALATAIAWPDPVVWSGRGRTSALVELGSAAAVRSYEPDLAALASLGTPMVIVTAPGDRPGIDFVSRVFAPNSGIPEDPVTGSAHCTLAGHWSGRRGTTALVGEQASRRGGIVRVRVDGERVGVAGRAVTTGRVLLEV